MSETEEDSQALEKEALEIPKLDAFSSDLVHRVKWPLWERGGPVLADGSTKLDKPFIFRVKENLWNSIDEHCRALGVDKSKWVREAILRQLYEEQVYFLKRKGQFVKEEGKR